VGENRSSIVSERDWQLSLDAEHNEKIKLLSTLAGQVVRGNGETLLGRLSESYGVYDEDEVAELIEEHLQSEFYALLNNDQKKQLLRSIEITPDKVWRYGNKTDEEALWDVEKPAYLKDISPEDSLVLSGLAGADLFGISKRLDRLAAGIEPDLLKRAVLLGGVALASPLTKHPQPGISYLGNFADGLRPETYIGGTHHGDFWTSRSLRFEHAVISPVGEALVFAPALEKIHIPGYHSTEPGVMRSLLAYQVAYKGIPSLDVFSKIEQLLWSQSPKGAGNFADFGEDDGRLDANMLDYLIKQGVDEDEVLLNTIVSPDNLDLRLQLSARKSGVEFAFLSGTDEYIRSFILPSEEIEAYVAHLVGSGFGRTSQYTLVNIVRVLKDGPPQRHERTT